MIPILTIIKIGGKIINEPALLDQVLEQFTTIKGAKILVHGGGRKATNIAQELGIDSQLIDGRRVTDADTLDVVVMTYAGLINKSIVAKLQAQNNNALGLSGADLNIMQSKKRQHPTIDYGFVGDVETVDQLALKTLLDARIVPVVCPITHDKTGQLLNTNADTIAASLAKALSRKYDVRLKYCFEYPGVLEEISNTNSVIPAINKDNLGGLIEGEILHSGMLPKIDNALDAKAAGVQEVSICGIENLIHQKNATWIQ